MAKSNQLILFMIKIILLFLSSCTFSLCSLQLQCHDFLGTQKASFWDSKFGLRPPLSLRNRKPLVCLSISLSRLSSKVKIKRNETKNKTTLKVNQPPLLAEKKKKDSSLEPVPEISPRERSPSIPFDPIRFRLTIRQI